MTDGFSVPGSTATVPLAASVARVAELADKLGLSHSEVFDVHNLSEASGVPAEVVGALLAGQRAGEPDLQARFLQRFDLLRRTRLKPNGRRYTQQEIADGAGMSRQQAGALINGDRRPTMEHCDAIQRFFKVHAGFLTAEDADALDGALQRTEQTLLQDFAGDGDPLGVCCRTTGYGASPGGRLSSPPTNTGTRSPSGSTCSWRASSRRSPEMHPAPTGER